MKAARILILAVALAAGGAAAFFTSSDIGMGTAISSQDLQSAPVPYKAASLPSGIRATGASS